MNGIFYFSSTGNSLYIAKKIKDGIGGKIVYLPKFKGDGKEFDKFILVSPIHSYGLPKLVYEFLPKIDKSKELIVILNFGGMVGGADYFTFNYCKSLNLNIRSLFLLQMPENFTTTFTVPKFYLKKVLKKAESKINKVVEDIKSEKWQLPKKKRTKEKKYFKNMSNWHKIGERFTVSADCVKCKKCVSVCPVGNIEFDEGKIIFKDKCVACLGCYHRCPNKAIIYKNHNKKDRYLNPNILDSEIGTDQ